MTTDVDYALYDSVDVEEHEVYKDGLYRDPPNINFGKAIPRESDWKFRRSDADDVAAACGDPRDWFRYWHRLKRQELYWKHYDYWAPKRSDDDYRKGFDWNQRLIIGQYGVGKTTVSIGGGKDRVRNGFPYFHNGPALIGWVIEGDDIFTAMAVIPACSTLTLDEAHATVPGRLGAGHAVSTFVTLGANIRKDNCKLDIITAQWEGVHPRIRTDCVEVLRPFKVNVKVDNPGSSVPTWDDPRNFVLAWDVWKNSPMLDPVVRKEGLDAKPPDQRLFVSGNGARDAFILTDSFQRVDAASAVLATGDSIKDKLNRIRSDLHKDGAGSPEKNAIIELVATMSFEDGLAESTPYMTAAQVSRLIAEDYDIHIDSRKIGTSVGELFGVKQRRNYGFPTAALIEGYHKYQARSV